MIGKSIHADDIRKCDLCGEGLAREVPLFYRVNLERMAVNASAVRSIVGLTTLLGSERLATVLSPDNEVAKPLGAPDELLVCQDCSVDRMQGAVAMLTEIAAQLAERKAARSR